MIGLLTVLLCALAAFAPRELEWVATHARAEAAFVAADSIPRSDSLPPAPAPRESVLTLPPVVVERSAPEARRRLPTTFSTEVRVGGPTRAHETLADALSRVAGVHVSQYGGLGAYSTVSLRGAPPGQVAIYLDGVPITSAAYGQANLADLPLTAIEKFDVYRGYAPLGLGVPTPGGAINFVTVSSPDLHRVSAARGSFGTWDARATFGASARGFAGLVHAGYQGSAGDFRFFDDNGTPYNPGDDSTSMRVNGRFDAATLLGTVSWKSAGGTIVRWREDYFEKSQGNPGQGATPARQARLAFTRAISQLDLERPGSTWRPRVVLGAALQRERSRAKDLKGQLGLGNHDADDRFAGERGTIELGWRLPLGGSLETNGMIHGERAHLHDELDGFPDPPTSRRLTTGAGASLDLAPLGDWLTLHAGGRWDHMDDRLRSLQIAGRVLDTRLTRWLASPRAGLGVRLPRGFELRGNRSGAERAPEFLELFGNQSTVLPNPRLVPEHGESWDAGGSWSGTIARRPLLIEGAHFESRIRDLIQYVQSAPGRDRAENVSRALIRGEELWMRSALPAGLECSGSWTAERAEDRGPSPSQRGRQLPERPQYEGTARLEWGGAFIRCAADAHWIGENFRDHANRQRIPPRALFGASIAFAKPSGALRLVVEGKNLGDDRAADVGGYPLPGRSFFVSCHVGIAEPAPGSP